MFLVPPAILTGSDASNGYVSDIGYVTLFIFFDVTLWLIISPGHVHEKIYNTSLASSFKIRRVVCEIATDSSLYFPPKAFIHLLDQYEQDAKLSAEAAAQQALLAAS